MYNMYILNREAFLFMIIHGATNYYASGRKKNSRTRRTTKRIASSGINSIPSYTYTRGRTDHIPSLDSGACATTVSKDAEIKKEVSKNYTVAVAYNKGAYQVIPKNGVKDIGR
jgi:hypothetical protein